MSIMRLGSFMGVLRGAFCCRADGRGEPIRLSSPAEN
jgi:hypothetical protein